MLGQELILQQMPLQNPSDMKYLIIVCLISNVMWSQKLDSHLWNDRVIIISADETNSKLAESQFNVLQAERDKLKDRKIVIYKCIRDNCIFYNGKEDSKTIKINASIKGFETILIGLDGGQKFKSKKLEKPSTFFNLIETMPMRQQELKNQKKRND